MSAGVATLLVAESLAIGHRGSRGERIIARDMNLTLRPGQLVALVGPNGAGKTTLLRTLAGLLPPLRGQVTLGSREVASLPPRERALGLAIVLTGRLDAPGLRARELVALGRYPHTGWSGALGPRDHDAVERAMAETNVTELADRRVDELSDGERQRVVLARALSQETPVLLLDEPTAFLDLPHRVAALGLLGRLARERSLAILLSTHDLDLALRMTDRLAALGSGGIFATDLPEQLALDGRFGRVFDEGPVQFDPSVGEFRVDAAPRGEVELIGAGPVAFWTARLLRRHGFSPANRSTGVVARIVIELVNGHPSWRVEQAGTEPRHARTLAELERLLTN